MWNRVHGQTNKKPSSHHQFTVFTMFDSTGRYLAKIVGAQDDSFCVLNAPLEGEPSVEDVVKSLKEKTIRALSSLSEPGHKFQDLFPVPCIRRSILYRLEVWNGGALPGLGFVMGIVIGMERKGLIGAWGIGGLHWYHWRFKSWLCLWIYDFGQRWNPPVRGAGYEPEGFI